MLRRNRGSVPWKIWVPADLALRVETRYCDPRTGKPQYATRSHLIVALLREFDAKTSELEHSSPGVVSALINRLISEGQGT